MAWNGSGVFDRLYNWVARRDAGAPTHFIDATTMDAEFGNYKTGLENCVTRNGENAASADLPMGAFKHLNVGAAALRSQYTRVAEAQDGTIWKAASPGGTIDAMTGTITPTISAYAANMLFSIVAPGSGANTVTAPTINLNSIGAKTIRKHQSALAVGDYSAGDVLFFTYDGTYAILLNPRNATSSAAIALTDLTTDATGGATGDFVPFVDVSDSNASNKVTVQDLFTNVLANFTADTTIGATGDKVLFSDASESNAAQVGTVDNLIKNVLSLLTTDATGGATDDLIAFCDTSESGAGNKVTVADLFYNALGNWSADSAPNAGTDYVGVRDEGTSMKKVLIKDLRPQECFIVAVGDEVTALTAGTGKLTFRFPYAFTVTSVRANLKTAAGSAGPFTVDINESGVSILSTKLTIDDTEKTSTTAATAAVISDASIADDAEMTIDIDDDGNAAAVGLKVHIYGYRS